MATIDIQDTLLDRLKQNARVKNLSLDQYLDSVVEADEVARRVRQREAVEEFIAFATDWGAKNLPPGHETDISRGSMYSPERGGE